MRWHTTLGITTLSAIAMGCSSLLGMLPIPGAETPAPQPVCVVRYEPLLPGWSLGSDGCGNLWVRNDDDGTCVIQVDSVTAQIIPCPAEGDTLGD